MACIIQLRHHYYRGYPPDFTAGRAAARTFLGWDAHLDGIDLDRSALILMHIPDSGLRPEVAWRPDNPRIDLLGSAEWVPRTMEMVAKKLPPLVDAARQARLQIAHVTMGNWYSRDYPQRKRCVEEAGKAPAPENEPLPPDPAGDWQSRRFKRVFRVPPAAPGADMSIQETQFYPGLEPRDDDLVCSRTWEFHRLLSARGIDHLIYTGWALNWCLWFSECGMNDMDRLRYRLYAVRGACVAIENAESAEREGNLEYAYWMTAAKFGDIFELGELIAALQSVKIPGGTR